MRENDCGRVTGHRLPSLPRSLKSSTGKCWVSLYYDDSNYYRSEYVVT